MVSAFLPTRSCHFDPLTFLFPPLRGAAGIVIGDLVQLRDGGLRFPGSYRDGHRLGEPLVRVDELYDVRAWLDRYVDARRAS
jgi:hypothetical protein